MRESLISREGAMEMKQLRVNLPLKNQLKLPQRERIKILANISLEKKTMKAENGSKLIEIKS